MMIKSAIQNTTKQTEGIRINKYLATQGVSTRRDADKLIEAGKVMINGRRAILGDKVKEGDKVEIKKRLKMTLFIMHIINQGE